MLFVERNEFGLNELLGPEVTPGECGQTSRRVLAGGRHAGWSLDKAGRALQADAGNGWIAHCAGWFEAAEGGQPRSQAMKLSGPRSIGGKLPKRA